VIHITDIFITVGDVLVRPFGVNIACVKGAIVVSERAFSDHSAYRSFQIITSFFFRRRAAGFVTFVKSNAKALSTAFVYQKVPLRSPRGLWGVAPLSADNTPAEPPFEKGTLHPA
jgi:hypothetical protein